MKKIILILITLFVPSIVSAAPCTDSQVDRFKKLTNEIQTTFDYVESDDNISFTINFHNVNKNLYMVDYNTGDNITIYKNSELGIISVDNRQPSKTYTFSVTSDNSICDSQIITTLKVTTPNYNKYYKDHLCSGIESYSLCQKWSNVGDISYAYFKKSVENYKKQNEVEEPTIDDNQTIDNISVIRNFIADNYIYIVIGMVVLVTIIIIIYKNKHKEDW